ncbi:WGR domain-containing protein [Phyllobacterium sp. YR531]|uniref:WGR domain-containing protein n=1 Tax=Phyllobacterium sp. YR531 TaxID=1144343 RepID=UPI00026FA976|nr:WGR domain-containing protein [Phyllobacterium sp. YR531]EJN05991.1 hypothetical protein PMI41_00583 [Phyllobacterium sp. YR531]
MSDETVRPVHLRRIDPTHNMRRFYTLSIQPTLFGGASLVRNWGRIGAKGQSMMVTFDESADAGHALIQLERAKRKRGYCDAGVRRRK